jgi:hypothetical protein
MQRESTAGRTGPLRNGNRRGDPNLAPRCGARTRAGCPCRGPAMANGRCRMHGGASTGPTTEAGRARIRAARTKHGGYGAQSQAALRRTDAIIADTRALLALLRQSGPTADPATLRQLLRPGPVRCSGKTSCNVRTGALGPAASGSSDPRQRHGLPPAIPGRNRKVSGTMANATTAEIVNTSQ